MKLRDHLKAKGKKAPAFAAEIGVTYQALHRYMSGERIPVPEVMDKIVQATSGDVQPADIYEAHREARAARSADPAVA